MDGLPKEYFVELRYLNNYKADTEQKQKDETQELAIRHFLLTNADMVRFTVEPRTVFPAFDWRKFSFTKKYGDEHDPTFQAVLEALKEDFIETIVNNERYHIEQSHNSRYTHYLYRLSSRMKDLFNTHTFFYTFEDPSFYQDQGLLGHVISHENMVMLNLTPTEKSQLEKQGVELQLMGQ